MVPSASALETLLSLLATFQFGQVEERRETRISAMAVQGMEKNIKSRSGVLGLKTLAAHGCEISAGQLGSPGRTLTALSLGLWFY